MKIEDIINLERYPISEPEHPSVKAVTSQCQRDLEENLYCVIPDFVSQAALVAMANEATRLVAESYHNHARRNCYLHRQLDPKLPPDHPRNMQDRSSVRMIAYDQVGPGSPLKTLYQSELVRNLVAEIVGEGELFSNADPYQPANYVCYREGDESAWHFDSDSSFTMTLMIQPAELGGLFEMSPNTRRFNDENYDHVKAVLNGRRTDVVSVGREPGALCIFRGCHSLHRVSPVAGSQLRIMGVFVYEFSPDIVGDPEVNATIYGARVVA